MEFIVVGEVLKAQGIKGEVKIRALCDDPMRFKKLKVVYIDNMPYKILSQRLSGEFIFISLSGVNDRNEAEKLAKKLVYIDKVNAVELPKDGYFISDIIGCELRTDSGEVLGVITDVDQFGAADVITAKNEQKEIRFPFLNKIVKNIDIVNKTFTVIAKGFFEVCVCED